MGNLKVEGLMKDIELNYVLKNIHFHSEAEHTVDGKRYTMEMHMVHQIVKKPKGMVRDKLVIAILFDCTAKGKYLVNGSEG